MKHDEIIKKNKEYFGRQWKEFSTLTQFADKNFANHLLKCTNSIPEDWKDKTVFEGGAGIGRNVIGALQLRVKNIVATELSNDGVEAIINNTQQYQIQIENIYQADLCNLEKEKDNTYDIVFSVNCLPHIPDYKKALKEMVRICKSNGMIMFNMPPQRPTTIAKNDKAIRELSTQFDEKGAKIFAKIMVYFANTSELRETLRDKMELSGDELSAYDHFMLPYTAEFTQEQIRQDLEELNCEILTINNLISVKARKK